jgi:hypothetical protein
MMSNAGDWAVQFDVAGRRTNTGYIGSAMAAEIGDFAVSGGNAAGIENVAGPALTSLIVGSEDV